MSTVRLATEGDASERLCWGLFVSSEFPAYERFWLQSVYPLREPGSISLRSDAALASINKTPHDVTIAQLHYTVLAHLKRAFEIRGIVLPNEDSLLEGVSRLSAALDVAFELLERAASPGRYAPWSEAGTKATPGGREARREWRTKNSNPLQDVYDYRNRLLHGRLVPMAAPSTAVAGNVLLAPRIGRQEAYVDWRALNGLPAATLTADFMTLRDVLHDGWNRVVTHLQQAWTTHLVASATAGLTLPAVAATIAVTTPASASFAIPVTAASNRT